MLRVMAQVYHIAKVMPTCSPIPVLYRAGCVLPSTLSISMQVLTHSTLYYLFLVCLSINPPVRRLTFPVLLSFVAKNVTRHSICSSLEPEISCYVVFGCSVVGSAGGSATKLACWLKTLAHWLCWMNVACWNCWDPFSPSPFFYL